MDRNELIALALVGVMIVFDYISGLAKAAMQHDISSGKMREGLYHKFAYILVMVLAEIVEHAQQVIDLGFAVPIVIPAAVYIVVTEITSILENIAAINPSLADSPVLKLFRTRDETQ